METEKCMSSWRIPDDKSLVGHQVFVAKINLDFSLGCGIIMWDACVSCGLAFDCGWSLWGYGGDVVMWPPVLGWLIL